MIERRKSKIAGWGVFATETIPKNKRIVSYTGEKISNKESLKRERKYIQKGHIWCFKLTNRTVIDAGVGGNIARFINHACKPISPVQHMPRGERSRRARSSTTTTTPTVKD